MPDFIFAVRDPRATLEAGLDLPALGSDSQLSRDDHLKDEPRLDSIALHVLSAMEHVNLKPMQQPCPQPPSDSALLAKEIAIEGMVLLKNDGPLLPLPETARIAVVDAGNLRALMVIGGAGSVSLSDERIESVPDALGKVLASPEQVQVAPAGDGEVPLPVVSAEFAAGVIVAVIRDVVTRTEIRRTTTRSM